MHLPHFLVPVSNLQVVRGPRSLSIQMLKIRAFCPRDHALFRKIFDMEIKMDNYVAFKIFIKLAQRPKKWTKLSFSAYRFLTISRKIMTLALMLGFVSTRNPTLTSTRCPRGGSKVQVPLLPGIIIHRCLFTQCNSLQELATPAQSSKGKKIVIAFFYIKNILIIYCIQIKFESPIFILGTAIVYNKLPVQSMHCLKNLTLLAQPPVPENIKIPLRGSQSMHCLSTHYIIIYDGCSQNPALLELPLFLNQRKASQGIQSLIPKLRQRYLRQKENSNNPHNRDCLSYTM